MQHSKGLFLIEILKMLSLFLLHLICMLKMRCSVDIKVTGPLIFTKNIFAAQQLIIRGCMYVSESYN